ncbi:uncharacterized protein LOC117301526 [Asterias rubens]|uniref:uncharacterized protein LOC117301526 n=1 Tax=Asterias rubens TaxID=7604 RepID=UPI00145540AD|nr:uncharacterized protein LOC117301526 [Asterias rubens]
MELLKMDEISDVLDDSDEISEVDIADINWCECCPSSSQEGSLKSLQETLPQGFSYICCRQSIQTNCPRVEFRINVTDELSAKDWIKKYQDKTLATWRISRTYPNRGRRTLCRLERRCQHMTCPRTTSANKRKSSKNTNCPAILVLIVRKTEFKRLDGTDRVMRSEDQHLPTWPARVTLKYEHNHPLKAADVLRHRDVSKGVRKKLIKLFRAGHNASSALNMHQYDLQMEHGNDYVFLSEDRHHNPDLNFTWRLYNQIWGKTSGGSRKKRLKLMSDMEDMSEEMGKGPKDRKAFCVSTNTEMVEMLREKINKYNLENGDCVRMVVKDDQLVMAIITPLMKRAHKMVKYSGEMVFMDASGIISGQNSHVFLMMTPSFAGGLPLGAYITTNDSKAHLEAAIRLGQEIVGDTAFYGRGSIGPEVFFTDDLEEERLALSTIYPQSTLILCIYQVLQSFWRHLFDPKFKNQREDGPYLFQLMKSMLYSSTADEIEAVYASIIHDSIVDKYPLMMSIYVKMYERKHEWALCYLDSLSLRGNNTSNYCESAMRILKDKIFHRAKTYSAVQLVDFLLTRMDQYYQTRLLDVSHNRLEKALGSRYISAGSPAGCTPKSQIVQESAMVFLVPHEKPEEPPFRVDMTVGLCTCKVGSSGGPCCHQKAILTGFYIPSWNFIPVNDDAMSKLLFEISGALAEDSNSRRKRHREESDVNDVEGSARVALEEDVSLETRRSKVTPVGKPYKAHQKKVLEDLDAFVTRIKNGFLNNPGIYRDALEDFVQRTKRFTSEAELVCSLYTFGE